jgi:flagellar basal body-associated protein FliL
MSSDAEVESAPNTPAPAGGSKIGLIAVVVVVVVVVAIIGAIFLMGSGGSIEGDWKWDSVKIYNEDGTINQEMTDLSNENMPDMTVSFHEDGTATGMDSDANSTWTTDGGKLTVTTIYSTPVYNLTTGNLTSYDNETDSITFDYNVSGNTLTLEYEEMDMKFKITAKRV